MESSGDVDRQNLHGRAQQKRYYYKDKNKGPYIAIYGIVNKLIITMIIILVKWDNKVAVVYDDAMPGDEVSIDGEGRMSLFDALI